MLFGGNGLLHTGAFSVLPVENSCRINTGSAGTADSIIMYASAAQTFAFAAIFRTNRNCDYSQKNFCESSSAQRKLILPNSAEKPVGKPKFTIYHIPEIRKKIL
jgi:hypothetical protein